MTHAEPRARTYDHARAWTYVRARGRSWTHVAAVARNSQVFEVYANYAGSAWYSVKLQQNHATPRA